MIRVFTYGVAACLLASLLLAGCEKEGGKYYLSGTSPLEKDPVGAATSPDPDNRAAAIIAWSNHDWGLKGPYLKYYSVALKSDESPVVRGVAVRALGKAGDKAYLPNVIAALNDESPAVRADATAALNQLGGEAAIDPLCQAAMQDKSLDVRVGAIWALRHYRTPQALRTLLKALNDETFAISYQAHAALVEVAAGDWGYDVSTWENVLGKWLTAPAPAATVPAK